MHSKILGYLRLNTLKVVFYTLVGNKIKPKIKLRSYQEYLEYKDSVGYFKSQSRRLGLEKSNRKEIFSLVGFCIPCKKIVKFRVDMQWGGYKAGDIFKPNWRERIVCPCCNLNNRQRLVAGIVLSIEKKPQKKYYFMEQVTDLYKFMLDNLDSQITGSEYLGDSYVSGDIKDGILHEDATHLSFEDGSLDVIVSNDVFEHVMDHVKAFKECYRVLKNGGRMIFTIPFHVNSRETILRATLVDNKLSYLLEPQFHGNPLDEKGSLVFVDYGWDILDLFKEIGFKDAAVDIYENFFYGHVTEQLVFEVVK